MSLISFRVSSASEIGPFYAEPVTLARALVFPLALEFVGPREFPPHLKIAVTFDRGLRLDSTGFNMFLRAQQLPYRQRFLDFAAEFAVAVPDVLPAASPGVLPRLEATVGGPGDFELWIATPGSGRSSDVQAWMAENERDLVAKYPFLGAVTDLVVADFLMVRGQVRGRARNSLYGVLMGTPDERKAGGPPVWGPIEQKLKLFGLSLFGVEELYAVPLRRLVERPLGCVAALEAR